MLQYQKYTNLYTLLSGLNNSVDIQHILRCISHIILLALTKLDLSPGRIKLALLSIDKLTAGFTCNNVHNLHALLKCIHTELLVDFTPDQLAIIDEHLQLDNNDQNNNGIRYVYKCNPAANNLIDEVNVYLNNYMTSSSSDQKNLLYGMVCLLIESGIQQDLLEDILYILSSVNMSVQEQGSAFLNRLDASQLSSVLKYKIPV